MNFIPFDKVLDLNTLWTEHPVTYMYLHLTIKLHKKLHKTLPCSFRYKYMFLVLMHIHLDGKLQWTNIFSVKNKHNKHLIYKDNYLCYEYHDLKYKIHIILFLFIMIHKTYHPLPTTSLTNLDSAAAHIQEFRKYRIKSREYLENEIILLKRDGL